MSTQDGQGAAKIRVLVVEDNDANRAFMLDALELFGFEATTVDNGRGAIEALERQSFDLVFMDCRMPEMDGFDATRNIRSLEQREGRPITPIIALTANAMAGDREKCLAAGMDDYLAKPVDLSQLKAMVDRYAGP